MKPTLLLDFDGVILDSFNAVLKINQALEPLLTGDVYRARFNGSMGEYTKKHTTPDSVAQFFASYDNSVGEMPIVPGMRTVVEDLAQDYQLIIISSSHSSSIRKCLVLHGIESYVTEVLGYDVEVSKTEKVKTVLENYQIKSKETLYITDTLGDILEARAAGVESIAVSWGYHDVETLKKGEPIAIVPDPLSLKPAIDAYFGCAITM